MNDGKDFPVCPANIQYQGNISFYMYVELNRFAEGSRVVV